MSFHLIQKDDINLKEELKTKILQLFYSSILKQTDQGNSQLRKVLSYIDGLKLIKMY